MQYSSHFLVKAYILILTATWGACWQFFTPLAEVRLTHTAKDERHIHSEYYFGRCSKDRRMMYYSHTHLEHMDVLGKTIVRGWIDVKRIPTCILLRARSYDLDMLQSTTYNFQMCVPRITYCHTHNRYKFHYYEWYIPPDFSGGMDWDIYFYGPNTMRW